MKSYAKLPAETSSRRAAAQPSSRQAALPAADNTRDAAQRERIDSAFGSAAQRVEDEELLQGRFDPAQRMEEEEMLQGKFNPAQRMEEEEPLQGKFAPVQRVEEEEMLQGKFDPAQRVEDEELLQGRFGPAQRADRAGRAAANQTGMPDGLRSGIESMSGLDLSDVRVHRNSDAPAQLDAHAYAQGNDIHLAPGQEQHLPHEAWHVVQQRQGRVQPTMQMGAVNVNDDAGLEAEADAMGAKALQHPGPDLG